MAHYRKSGGAVKGGKECLWDPYPRAGTSGLNVADDAVDGDGLQAAIPVSATQEFANVFEHSLVRGLSVLGRVPVEGSAALQPT